MKISFNNFLSAVYLKMTIGLILSTIVAWACSFKPSLFITGFHITGLGCLFLFAPLILIIIGAFIRGNGTVNNFLFYAICATIGVSLYIGCVPINVHHIYLVAGTTALFFTILTTIGARSNMTEVRANDIRSLLFAGLIALILMSVIMIFVHAPGMVLAMSIFSLILFSGLIIMDTRQLLFLYEKTNNLNVDAMTTNAALGLYLDVINLFQALITLTNNNE